MLLGDLIAAISAGVSLQGENRPPASGEVGILTLSALSGAHLDATACKAISVDSVPKLGPSVQADTILMSRSNTPDLVGSCVYVEESIPDRYLPDLIWEVKIRRDVPCDGRWLTEYLRSGQGRRNLLRAAAGTSGSMIKLSMDRLRRLKIVVPPIDVQYAIVSSGGHLDRMAAGLSMLVEAKRMFKRGLSQRLLIGRNRYPEFVQSADRQSGEFGTIPDDWSLVHISDIASEVKARGEGDGAIVYSCTKYDGLVPSLEYFGKQVFSRNLSEYKRLQIGDFAYATNHIEEGSIGLLRDGKPPGLVSPMYTVFRPSSRVNPEFLFALFKTESYRRVFEKRTSASVDRRGSLRWKEFSRIRVGLPSVEEQDLIAGTLRLVDAEIDQLERLHELIIVYKRTLLSQLLNGELSVASS